MRAFVGVICIGYGMFTVAYQLLSAIIDWYDFRPDLLVIGIIAIPVGIVCIRKAMGDKLWGEEPGSVHMDWRLSWNKKNKRR